MDDGVILVSDRERGREDVHRAYPGTLGVKGAQGLLVGIGSVSREDDELRDSSCLPCAYEVVEEAMEGLGMCRGASREMGHGWGVRAIFYGGSSKYLELGGEVIGKALDDDGVTTQREMGAVLLGRSDRHDQSWITREVCAHLAR
jgi:hypothetical protein